MKKNYQKPALQVLIFEHEEQLLGGSKVGSVNTNLADDDDFEFIGGSYERGR